MHTIIKTVEGTKKTDKMEDKIQVFTPVVVGRKGEYYQLLYDMLSKGYEKAKIDGKIYRSC